MCLCTECCTQTFSNENFCLMKTHAQLRNKTCECWDIIYVCDFSQFFNLRILRASIFMHKKQKLLFDNAFFLWVCERSVPIAINNTHLITVFIQLNSIQHHFLINSYALLFPWFANVVVPRPIKAGAATITSSVHYKFLLEWQWKKIAINCIRNNSPWIMKAIHLVCGLALLACCHVYSAPLDVLCGEKSCCECVSIGCSTGSIGLNKKAADVWYRIQQWAISNQY